MPRVKTPILSRTLATEILDDCEKLIEFCTERLRENPELDIDIVAKQLETSRITLWRRLTKCNTTWQELKKKAQEEARERKRQLELKLEKKLEAKRIPPENFEEFTKRTVVVELIEKLQSASISEYQRRDIIKTWWRIITTYNQLVRSLKQIGDPLAEELYEITPEDFTDTEIPLREKQRWVEKVLAVWKTRYADINNQISRIQSLQKYLEVQILPSFIEQQEYQGKYSGAYIPPHVMEKLVYDVLELFERSGNVFYLKCAQAILFLAYTGSRREALTNYRIIHEGLEIRNEMIIQLIGDSKVVVVETEEKGKKGRKIKHHKIIPYSIHDVALPSRFSRREVEKLAELVRKLLVEKYLSELNEVTKLYLTQAKRSLHLLRHTSAYTYLVASNYNMFLVSKLLGWIKADNLKIYANPTLMYILSNVGGRVERVRFFENEEQVFARIREALARVNRSIPIY
jgi:acetoin utilization deacetylase AcuC-like enzyme